MRDSNYWLRVIIAAVAASKLDKELNSFISESEQLKKILGSIVTKTNKSK
jgi:hypothetical protein